MLAVPLGPEIADGRTLEAGVYEKSNTVRKECCNDGPADVREPRGDRFGEDPEVQENDRNLRKHDNNLVDVLVDVEVLVPRVNYQKVVTRA